MVLPARSTIPGQLPPRQPCGQSRIGSSSTPTAAAVLGGPETQAAPEAIKLCFELHEALTYRPRDPQGRLRHEFPAMLRRLMQSLGVFESQGDGGVLSIETELIPAEVAAQRIGVK